MRNTLIFLILALTTNLAKAQFIKEKSINAQIGYGLSAPLNSVDIVNDGFFTQGELVLKIASWIKLRPYAGLVFTNSNRKDVNDNPTD